MTTATQNAKTRGLGLLLLAAFVALATLIGGAGTASAATGSHAGNRVGASTPLVVNIVGVADGITAGQRLGNTVPRAEVVVATGVAANSGNRVFWSGGDMAKDAAATFAKSNGGKTLEMTRTGKTLEWATDKTSYSVTKPLWNQASKRFANGASGQADVFFGPGGPSPMSIYSTIENPILQRNGVSITTQWAW